MASLATGPGPAAPTAQTSRLQFVDNLRVYLTVLVILHHLMITYTGTGSWYYQEGGADFVSGALGFWFQATNQAYFMGLFLLISAYFVPGSYDRKGPWRFLKDRFLRLGIPLVLYCWLIRPLLMWQDPVHRWGSGMGFTDFLIYRYLPSEGYLGDGPTWFIETLLIFSLFYVVWRLLTSWLPRATIRASAASFPGSAAIVLFALAIALVAFAVRQRFPIMSFYKPLNLQFPFFTQYIALFIAGLVAYRRGWFGGLPDAVGRRWVVVAVLLIVTFWPLMLGGGAVENGLGAFLGGMRWQALAYAVWESCLAVAMCVALVYLFRRYANRQGALAAQASRAAYSAYLIHPLAKFALVSLVAAPLCFALGALLRRLPGADRVL